MIMTRDVNTGVTPMPRQKLGLKQEFFSFAITPKTEHEREVVARLKQLRATNEFTRWIRTLIDDAIQNEQHDRPARPKSMHAPMPSTEPHYEPVND